MRKAEDDEKWQEQVDGWETWKRTTTKVVQEDKNGLALPIYKGNNVKEQHTST